MNIFQITNPRWKLAIKVAIATLIAGWATLAMHAEYPFWAPAIIIILMNDHFEGSLTNGIQRVVSTIFGAVFALWLSNISIDSLFILSLILFIVTAVCIYGFIVYGGAWLNFGVTFTFITLLLILKPTGGFDIACWRATQIVLGVIIWLMMSAFIFPNFSQRDTKDLFRQFFAKCGATLQNTATYSNTWEKDKQPLRKLLQKLNTVTDLLPNIREKKYIAKQALNEAWESWRSLYALLSREDLEIDQHAQTLTKIGAVLTEFGKSKLTPTDILLTNNELSTQLDILYEEITNNSNAETNDELALLAKHWIESVQECLAQINAWQLGKFNNIKINETKRVFETIWREIVAQPERVLHCVNASLGCILVVYVWLYTGWMGGICAGVSALVVGADFNLSKINLKIRLRLYGSILGSLLSVFLVTFFVKGITSLLICLFIPVLIFAYLASGGFKQMYFCWMATMSFVITMIPGAKMANSFDFTLERSVGLIFGLAVIAFSVNFLFPINPLTIMRRHERRSQGKIADFWLTLAKTISKPNSTTISELLNTHKMLRQLLVTGDSLAIQTEHSKEWKAIRERMIATTHCYNYATTNAINYMHENEEQLNMLLKVFAMKENPNQITDEDAFTTTVLNWTNQNKINESKPTALPAQIALFNRSINNYLRIS